MDLTPGEKAVLGQIRALYAIEASRDHQVKALMMQWPPIHHEAYKRAYAGLVARALIEDVGTQLFRITEAGLGAIGVARPTPQQAQPKPQPMDDRKPVAATPAASKPREGVLSRLMGLLRQRA